MRGKLRQRIRLGKVCHEMVACYARMADAKKATEKRRVRLEIVLKGRQQPSDSDSLQKATNDALVACGMLVDDSSQWTAWGGVVYSREGEPGTTIILEDV